ncbi:MAG: hypothetical protein AAGD10_00725 [Myxococcota bacterium]
MRAASATLALCGLWACGEVQELTDAGPAFEMGQALDMGGALDWEPQPRTCQPYRNQPDEVVCGESDEQLTFGLGDESRLDSCTRFRGSIHIPDATREEDLALLSGLRRIDGRLTIFRNHALADLSVLSKLESVGGLLSIDNDDSNGRFTSLHGLESLCELGALNLSDNRWLRDIAALSKLEVIHDFMTVTGNRSLPTAAIEVIARQVDVRGETTIEGNSG